MEALSDLLKFISSYPVWAKVLIVFGVGVSGVTLIFAPRIDIASAGPTTATPIGNNDRIFMRLKPIRLFSDDLSAEVRITAYVNGTEFVYPSIAGVRWMKVGPEMSETSFELPKSTEYHIRFEMLMRERESYEDKRKSNITQFRFASQEIERVITAPNKLEYELYRVDGMTPSSSMSAVILYELYRQ